jgi:hypothetical protein
MLAAGRREEEGERVCLWVHSFATNGAVKDEGGWRRRKTKNYNLAAGKF